MLSKNDIFAFDECSILHLCEVLIPPPFKIFFTREKLVHKNFSKLNTLLNKLEFNCIDKYRFDPSNFEENAIRAANELLEKEGNQVKILPVILKSKIIDQILEFIEEVIHKFKIINKNDSIYQIESLFKANEINLMKDRNLPEEDDFKIISGYNEFIASGKKYLITEDEHFWGYSKLIEDNYNIIIVKEWECHKF